MEVGFRGGTVAEVDGGDGVLSPELGDVGVPDRVGELGGDGHGGDAHPEAAHVPAVIGQASPVGHDGLDRDSPGHLHTVFAIGRENEVVLCQSQRRTDLDCFLALEHRVGADPTLALQGEHPAIELAAEDHQSVHLAGDGRIDPGVGSGQRTVGSQDLRGGVRGHRFEVCHRSGRNDRAVNRRPPTNSNRGSWPRRRSP